jgi:hypothetical protein
VDDWEASGFFPARIIPRLSTAYFDPEGAKTAEEVLRQVDYVLDRGSRGVTLWDDRYLCRNDALVSALGEMFPGLIFVDVPVDYWAHDEIEALYLAGYTAGCGEDPLRYCPDQAMIRAESAVFVGRGLHGADFEPAMPEGSSFADVPAEYWGLGWIESLWEDGYTAGCAADPLSYCPLQEHTRAEGCVFYLRMLNGPDYEPPEPVGAFGDVPAGWWGAGWVEAAVEAGLIEPCQAEPEAHFCPMDPLDRGLAAYMMVHAKGLTIP